MGRWTHGRVFCSFLCFSKPGVMFCSIWLTQPPCRYWTDKVLHLYQHVCLLRWGKLCHGGPWGSWACLMQVARRGDGWPQILWCIRVVFLSIAIIFMCAHLFFKLWSHFRFTENYKGSTESSCVPFTHVCTALKEFIWPQPLAWSLEHGDGQLILSQEWTDQGACHMLPAVLTGSLALMATLQ